MTPEEREINEAQKSYLALLLESGCKFVLRTILFGKEYVWIKDKYGQLFLERVPAEDPTYSIDGQTGEVEEVHA